MKLYTIGFSGKCAEQFFTRLTEAHVGCVIDVRLNPTGQLSGFAKARDLPFFLKALCDIDYRYLPDLAPPADLLEAYRKKKIDWLHYEEIYNRALEKRVVENCVDLAMLDGACLLCSEDLPDQCHRRLAAEYLSKRHVGLEIIHL